MMQRLGDIVLDRVKVVRGDEHLFMETIGASISWHCRRHGLVRPEIVRGDGKDYQICWQCYNESDDTPDCTTGPKRAPTNSGHAVYHADKCEDC